MAKEYIEREKAVELIKNYGKGAISDGRKTLGPVDDIVSLAKGFQRVYEGAKAEWRVGF